MLSIFTTCRPFNDESDDGRYIAAIQRYCLRTLKETGQEVFLVYDDDGVAEVAQEFDFQLLKRVRRHASGAPSLRYAFKAAIKAATHDVIMYTNADIMFLDDLLPAVEALHARDFEKWMATGGRWDVSPLGLKPWPVGEAGWQRILRDEMHRQNRFHGGGALDYFIFSRGLYEDIPASLAIGAWKWDNWMIWQALQKDAEVIDTSAAITAVHLDHPKKGARENSEAVAANHAECQGKVCTTSNSQWRLTKELELVERRKL